MSPTTCPTCGGPAWCWADRSEGVTVNFACDNAACAAGKGPWDTPRPEDEDEEYHCCDQDEDLDYGNYDPWSTVKCEGCGAEMEYTGDGTSETGNGREWWTPIRPPVTRGSYDGMAPANPVVGHVHHFGTLACRWDGTRWETLP